MLGSSLLQGDLPERISSGARGVGIERGLVAVVDRDRAEEPLLRVSMGADDLRRVPWPQAGYVLALSDLSGAALFVEEGYFLLAGTLPFLQNCLIEGIAGAISQFARTARKLASRQPKLLEVAQAFPAHQSAWSVPNQVPQGSVTAEQLTLMEALLEERIPPAEFARQWLSARRRSLAQGESLRGAFGEIFDRVFYALDDYVADPSLRERGDLSDDDLVRHVRAAMKDLSTLNARH